MNAGRIILLLALLIGALFTSGCASTADQNDVSTIPWDRPQSWEGAGALGGFRPPGQ